jgi:ABC-2 type transport system ATP-binding protein
LSDTDSVIRVEGLRFGYRRRFRMRPLYDGFDLLVDRPGVYGVFGRNGSGKSTLLKLLAGLLFPRGGRILVNGHEPRFRDPGFLEQVCLVPEEFHLPDLSPEELAGTHAQFYPRFSPGAFAEYLQVFEVPAGDAFEQMSLGQKKKAALAFALAANTPVLLLDEPTNGLDILGRDQFRSIMARPEHAARITLISTHQAHDLEQIMGHILFIDSARVALSATMKEVAGALRVGVADGAIADDAVDGDDVLYREALGERTLYVARNSAGTASPVNLELLYKALSRNRDGVLAAMRTAREAAHA